MSDGNSRFEKEVVEKEDGRYLVLYTFPRPDERDEEASSKVESDEGRDQRSEHELPG